MSKFALFHSEEFTHPKAAFVLGLLITIINLSCEIANLLTTLSQTTPSDVLSKFVAFKILI